MSSAIIRGSRRFASRHLSRHAGTLVLADHNNKELNEATLHAVTAAGLLGGDITMLVAGKDCDSVTAAAKAVQGVAKVVTCSADAYNDRLAEATSALLTKAQAAGSYTHIVACNSNFSKNIMARLSGLIDKPLLTDIIEITSPTEYVRPIYAGNALATFQCNEDVTLLTVRQTSFDPAETSGGSASEESLDAADGFAGTTWVSNELSKSEGPTLSAASKVVSGGRGMKNGDNFEMLHELAGKLGDCAVGASRAAVDAGFCANDMQVGQTGKVVAPDLYMAVGISGAIQHLAGMKDSKTIVCINKDPEAPIFQVSDFGLEADLFKAVPEINGKL